MKIVLLVLNGDLAPYHLTDYAVSLAKTGQAFLHTVFLSHSPAFEEYNYPFPNDLSLTRNRLSGKIIEEENDDLLKDNICLFEDKCKAANVAYSIEPGKEMTLGTLIGISSFADYILADARAAPGSYHLADLLADAHCPVLLLPASTESQTQLLFTYDGNYASMFAIKTFSQLFPEWKDLAVRLLWVTENENPVLPGEKYITNWLNRHYSNVSIEMLNGELKETLVNYIRGIPQAVVVMGSFGRSPVSRFFRESLANAIIEECSSSLFITHPRQ